MATGFSSALLPSPTQIQIHRAGDIARCIIPLINFNGRPTATTTTTTTTQVLSECVLEDAVDEGVVHGGGLGEQAGQQADDRRETATLVGGVKHAPCTD